MTIYTGHYINLDRSAARREAMEAQFHRLGLTGQYRRFAATDARSNVFSSQQISAPELACFTSHFRLLTQQSGSAAPLHIIEDDVVFAGIAGQVIAHIIGSNLFDQCDLLFTDMCLPLDLHFLRDARTRLEAAPHGNQQDGTKTVHAFTLVPYAASMTSYLVNPRALPMLCALLREELERGAGEPVDVFILRMVRAGRLRAQCLFPFVTSFVPGRHESTIARPAAERESNHVLDILRHSFFVDCNRDELLALADRTAGSATPTFHAQLLARLIGFMTSAGFTPS